MSETMKELVIAEKSELVAIANAIRQKASISDGLAFPDGFTEAIESFDGGGNTDIEDAFVTGTLSYYENSRVSFIGASAFYNRKTLTSVNFPVCTSIGNYAFTNCTSLTEVNFPVCTSIGSTAFAYCSSLTSVNFSVCTSIGNYAFSSCSSLQSVSFPVCTEIGAGAFRECPSLQSVSFPVCTSIGGNAFYKCSSLQSVSFPVCTSIGNYAFRECPSLQSVSFPVCTRIGSDAFVNCTSLIEANFPSCISVLNYAFQNCESLQSINFPVCEVIDLNGFNGCINLTEVNLLNCGYIGYSAFGRCTSLTSLILGASSVATLASADAFYSTPMSDSTYTSSFGSIYVPASLVNAYKSATNWAVYADRITLSDGVLISDIENNIFIFGESKQFSLPITRNGGAQNHNITATITSTNESIISISNINTINDLITFTATAQQTEGTTTININVTCGEYFTSTNAKFRVFESIPEATYEVQTVDGASYGFELNDDGYYESNNKGMDTTAAVCKLVFNTHGLYNLYLDCINSGENNYDYGLISQIDTTLSTTSSDDGSTGSTKVLKNFKGSSSTSIQTVELGSFEEGEHFIYIKFKKDNSSASGNDSLQFKVRMEA